MSGRKSSRTGTRLFVSLDPPSGVRDEVARWSRAVAGHGKAMRPVPAGSSHITLAFIGEVPESQVDPIAEALDSAATAVAGLSLGAPVWLPKRRPRVLALDIHDARGELAACQARVAGALEEAIGWQSDRPFRAHLTAIRLGRGFQPEGFALPVSPAIDFKGEAVSLYASRLLPEGARYDLLATVSFP